MNDDTLAKLFEYSRQINKDLAACQSDLNAHLETSIIRVEGYDKDISSVKADIKSLKERIEAIDSFITDYKGQKKGEDSLKSILKNALGVVLTLVGILISWLAIRK
jgi:predicted  nucleic acid-binding Zn-ribbon protein